MSQQETVVAEILIEAGFFMLSCYDSHSLGCFIFDYAICIKKIRRTMLGPIVGMFLLGQLV